MSTNVTQFSFLCYIKYLVLRVRLSHDCIAFYDKNIRRYYLRLTQHQQKGYIEILENNDVLLIAKLGQLYLIFPSELILPKKPE